MLTWGQRAASGSGFCKSACFNCNFSSVLQLVFPNRKVLHLFVCRGKFYQISHWFAYVDVGELTQSLNGKSKASSLPGAGAGAGASGSGKTFFCVRDIAPRCERFPNTPPGDCPPTEVASSGVYPSRWPRYPQVALPVRALLAQGKAKKCSSWSHLGYTGGARKGHARTLAQHGKVFGISLIFYYFFLPAVLVAAECFLKFIKFVKSGPFIALRGELRDSPKKSSHPKVPPAK